MLYFSRWKALATLLTALLDLRVRGAEFPA